MQGTWHSYMFTVIRCCSSVATCCWSRICSRAAMGKQAYRINQVSGKGGWRLFTGRKYHGYFTTKRAAEEAAKRLSAKSKESQGLSSSSSSSLRVAGGGARAKGKGLSPGPSRHSSAMLYKHVRVRDIKGKLKFDAQVRGSSSRKQVYLGRFDKQKEAADASATYLQRSRGEILRPKALRFKPTESAERMRLLTEMFAGMIPADLASAIEFRRHCQELHAAAPCLHVAGLLGKEDAWKRSLIHVWQALPTTERLKISGLSSQDETLKVEAAKVVHAVFTLSCGLWAGWGVKGWSGQGPMPWPTKPDTSAAQQRQGPMPQLGMPTRDRAARQGPTRGAARQGHMPWPRCATTSLQRPAAEVVDRAQTEHAWWNTHVNRNVQNHLSFTAWALKNGILRKTPSIKESLGIQNSDGEYYAIADFDKHEHTEKFVMMHRTGMALCSTPTPRDNIQWLKAFQEASKVAQMLGVPTPGYHWPWLLRTHMFVEMRVRGIRQLSVVRDWGEAELMEACRPDMSGWIPIWMKSVAGNSLKKLIRFLSYKEPLELLGCFACLLGDSTIQSIDQEQLKRFARKVKERRRQMVISTGREPHPVMVVQSVIDDGNT